MAICIRAALLVITILSVGYIPNSEASSDQIAVSHPAPGAVVRPGQYLSVELTVAPDLDCTSVGVFPEASTDDEEFIIAEDSTPPYEVTFVVPQSLIGPLKINAFGTCGGDEPLVGQSVVVNVVPMESPKELEAYATGGLRIVDGRSSSGRVHVTGVYPDGVRRDLSGASMGASYSSSDVGIVIVDADGNLQPTGLGSAVVSITSGGKNAFAAVLVTGEDGRDIQATEVTHLVSVRRSGIRFDTDGRYYAQEIIVGNTSATPIVLPLSIVISDLPPGVVATNAMAKTKAVLPLGSVVLNAASSGVSDELLAPGETAKGLIKLINVEGRSVDYTVRVFQGDDL